MNLQSIIFSKYLSDGSMNLVLGDQALVNKILLFEIMLAKAQARLGIICDEVAHEIEKKLSRIDLDLSEIATGTLENRIPVVTILKLAKEQLSEDAQKYLHYGSTSQDAMDTAQMLIFRDALKIIEEKI